LDLERKENALGQDIGIVVALLMALGTVFVFSASANLSQEFDFQKFYNFQSLRRILFFPLAVSLMFAVSCFDYRRFSAARSWWRTPVSYMLGFSVLLLAMVLIPKFGTEVNEARRWIRIPAGPFSISFQPSELAKWSLLFFMAAYCAKYADELGLFFKRFLPVCAVIALVAGLVILEDFGTAALITVLSFSMLLIAGVKWWHVLGPMPFGLTAFLFAILSSETRKNRITAFLHPDQWVDSINFQPKRFFVRDHR
jgi:cell division protein FtsW